MNSYGYALDVKIQPQVTPSYGPDAIQCLRHDDVLYVDQNDNIFSGSREADGLLIRYGAWESPSRRTFDIVGQWCGYFAVLDLDDGHTVYVHGAKKGHIPSKVLHQDLVLTLAAGDAIENTNDLSIYIREGWLDIRKVDAWVGTPELPWGSSPVQL